MTDNEISLWLTPFRLTPYTQPLPASPYAGEIVMMPMLRRKCGSVRVDKPDQTHRVKGRSNRNERIGFIAAR